MSELDLVLQRHQGLQEKLAEEMLGLARSLKTNTLAAQSVIKKDNQVWGHCSLCLRALMKLFRRGHYDWCFAGVAGVW